MFGANRMVCGLFNSCNCCGEEPETDRRQERNRAQEKNRVSDSEKRSTALGMDDQWAPSSSHVYLVLASGAGEACRRGCMLFSQFVHVRESRLPGEKD